jgi:hypothetical protein
VKIKLTIIGGGLLMFFVSANAQTNTNSAPEAFVVSTTIIRHNESYGKNFKSVFRVSVANQPTNGLLRIHSSNMSNIVQVSNESEGDGLFTNNNTIIKVRIKGLNVWTKEKIGTNDVSFTAEKP